MNGLGTRCRIPESIPNSRKSIKKPSITRPISSTISILWKKKWGGGVEMPPSSGTHPSLHTWPLNFLCLLLSYYTHSRERSKGKVCVGVQEKFVPKIQSVYMLMHTGCVCAQRYSLYVYNCILVYTESVCQDFLYVCVWMCIYVCVYV